MGRSKKVHMNNRRERKSPKPYHHGDLRHALITAGLQLLTENGAASLDLRKVARKVGVSHNASYYHFPDKQSFLAALNEEGFHRLAHATQEALSTAPDTPFDQLQAITRAYLLFAQANPALMREMFSGLTIEREAFPGLQAALKEVYRFYIEAVKRGQEQRRVIDGDPCELASVVWSLLHGTAMLLIEHQMRPYADGPEGVERMVRLCTQTLYTGLGREEQDASHG
jgi:AcrR family transcriptional regulator